MEANTKKIASRPRSLLSREQLKEIVIPSLIGIVAFLLVVGFGPLNPRNIAWIPEGDSRQYYLSWLFFRDGPWTWPVGLNPNFGMEISSSIVFSDTNPLFAIVFKLLNPILPETFQYFGVWLLMCFVLQAVFSWRLLGVLGTQPALQFLGTIMITLAPPMLVRVGGHFNLAAHFFVVAALYYAVSAKSQRFSWHWIILASTASLVHSYLMMCVLAIWIASLLDRAVFQRTSVKKLGVEAILVLAAVYLCLKLSGYFVVGDGVVGGGYGLYRMNLLSPIDSNGWSRLPMDFAGGEGDYEGFNFFGIGGLILVISGIGIALAKWPDTVKSIRSHSFLIVATVTLAIYALSNNVGIGAENFSFELPEIFSKYANIFRASGRFFWVAYYLLIACSIAAISRWMPKRVALGLVALATVAQITDIYPRLSQQHEAFSTLSSSSFNFHVEDNFWNIAASQYTSIRRLKPDNQLPRWQEVAWIAGTRGLTTDSIFFARINHEKLEALRSQAERHLNGATLNASSLYIVDPESFVRLKRYLTSDDWVGQVNGFIVVAPLGNRISALRNLRRPLPAETYVQPPEDLRTRTSAPSEQIGGATQSKHASTRFSFGTSGTNNAGLTRGWSHLEPWGVWSDGSVSELNLEVPKNAKTITFNVNALTTGSHPSQKVDVTVNAASQAQEFSLAGNQSFVVVLPSNHQGDIKIIFRYSDAVSPANLGLGPDTRQLAIGIIGAEIR